MAVIVNPRGPGGSGKTELVRRVMTDYGWRRGLSDGPVSALYRPARAAPIGYRLTHPHCGRPLVVLGTYERTSGGCDTISLAEGGLGGVFDFAARHAGNGCDVLIEGLRLSGEHVGSAALARAHPLHVFRLDVPPELCRRNLVARRRGRRDAWPAIERVAAEEARAITEACERLGPHATVHALDFDGTLQRIREVLGLTLPPGTTA